MPFITQGKTNWKFLVIVIVLAAVAGGGILWCTSKQEVLFTEFPEIKIPEDETADWKAYRNEEYWYKIKYPSDWERIDADPGTYVMADNDELLAVFWIADDSIGDMTIDNFFDEVEEDFIKEDLAFDPCTNKKEIKVGGEKAIRCDWVRNVKNSEMLQELGLEGPEEFDYSYIYIVHQFPSQNTGFLSFLIVNSLSGKKGEFYPIFDQMLSTFKFLD